ncbi:MAG: isocitrate/isopropylmalate dehydrogenase family protein [Candidatus Omnitrophica bacterium]|nr:isocitrate/isopropylmalate dehydrogenase family protein [Candidatus Omnitrophota bacterium]
MGRYRVTLIPGDGIGPEVTQVVKRCIEALDVGIEWEVCQAGESALGKYGTPLPEETIASIKRTGICLKAPLTTPVGRGFRSINVTLRQTFSLYVCLRPFKIYPGVRTRFKNVDLVVIRENMEDLYAGIEFERGKEETGRLIDFIKETTGKEILPDSGISIKPISVTNSERIIRFAFEYAIKNKRRKVTAVHKANIMKYTDGLFLEVARNLSSEYSQIEFEEKIVDNMAMQLVQKPELYDVLVCPNLYGDILSDLCAGLVGGLGLSGGANIGEEVAIFEATHGSAPKYKGLNKVNPSAMVLAGILMLEYLGEGEAARRLEEALASVIKEGQKVTYDLKEPGDTTAAGTMEMGQAILARLKI